MKTIKKNNITFHFNVGNCSIRKYTKINNLLGYTQTEIKESRQRMSEFLFINGIGLNGKTRVLRRISMLSFLTDSIELQARLFQYPEFKTWAFEKYNNGNYCLKRRYAEKLERFLKELTTTEAFQMAMFYAEEGRGYDVSNYREFVYDTFKNSKSLKDVSKFVKYDRANDNYRENEFHSNLANCLNDLALNYDLKTEGNQLTDFTRLTTINFNHRELESKFHDLGGNLTNKLPLGSQFRPCQKTGEFYQFLGKYSKLNSQRDVIRYDATIGIMSAKYVNNHMTECKQCRALTENDKIVKMTDKTEHLHLLSVTRNNYTEICNLCYSSNKKSITRNSIRAYHSNPSLQYHYVNKNNEIKSLNEIGNLKNELLVGIECEIEAREHINQYDEKATAWTIAHESSNLFWTCRDGSVSRGFEVISHPSTFDVFRKLDLNQILLRHRKDYRGFYSSNCGIHIHVNRSAFDGETHLFRFLSFINKNVKFSKVIGQRRGTGGDWCQYSSNDVDRCKSEIVSKYKRKDKRPVRPFSDRYKAVNLMNSATIEVRIFKSNLDEQGFRKNLDFVESLFYFTQQSGNVNFNDLSKYCSYIAKNQKSYPNLFEFLCREDVKGEVSEIIINNNN